MNTKFPALALSLGLLLSTASTVVADGTYVYGDGTTKDYMAGIPVPAPMPIPMHDAQWYIRLDIGGSFVGDVGVDVQGGGIVPRDAGDIPTSVFGEGGFGYRFNKNFRADFTSSFHDEASLTNPLLQTFVATLEGVGIPDPNPPNTNTTIRNFYNVERTDEVRLKNQSTNLVNFYYDIANESRFTPYLGVGVGVSYVNTERVTREVANCFQGQQDFPSGIPAATVNTGCHNTTEVPSQSTTTQAVEESEWLFSGALMAGFSYDVNDYVALDAGYRLLYSPGSLVRVAPTVTGTSQITWDDFLQHQFRTGIRLKIY